MGQVIEVRERESVCVWLQGRREKGEQNKEEKRDRHSTRARVGKGGRRKERESVGVMKVQLEQCMARVSCSARSCLSSVCVPERSYIVSCPLSPPAIVKRILSLFKNLLLLLANVSLLLFH